MLYIYTPQFDSGGKVKIEAHRKQYVKQDAHGAIIPDSQWALAGY